MKKKTYHQRFDLVFIIQHIILFSSVLLLIVSGVPLKFPESQLAVFVINLQGGMKMRSLIHHSAGLTLMSLGAFHFIYYVFIDRTVPFYKREIIPKLQDLRDLYNHFKYVVGLADRLPPMGRYTWYEKFVLSIVRSAYLCTLPQSLLMYRGKNEASMITLTIRSGAMLGFSFYRPCSFKT